MIAVKEGCSLRYPHLGIDDRCHLTFRIISQPCMYYAREAGNSIYLAKQPTDTDWDPEGTSRRWWFIVDAKAEYSVPQRFYMNLSDNEFAILKASLQENWLNKVHCIEYTQMLIQHSLRVIIPIWIKVLSEKKLSDDETQKEFDEYIDSLHVIDRNMQDLTICCSDDYDYVFYRDDDAARDN